MRIFDLLKRMAAQNDAQLWGEWCARTMFIAFKANMDQHRSATAAFMAREALLVRKKWKAVGKYAVCFTETGQVVEIPNEFSLFQAINEVIDVEYGYELRNRPSPEKLEGLRLCHKGAERFLDEYFNKIVSMSGR